MQACSDWYKQLLGEVSVGWRMVLAQVLAATIFYVAIHRWKQRSSKDPLTWPVIGCQLEASQHYDDLFDWMTQFFSADHRTLRIVFLLRNSLLTVDPANVEYILKTNFANFPKGQEIHDRNYDLLGKGILNVDGDDWRKHRKFASFEFSVRKLRDYTNDTYRNGAVKLAQAVQLAIRASSDAKAIVDAQELFLAMTFQSIWKVVTGDDSVGDDTDAAVALDNAQEVIMRRYQFPWWKLQRFFNAGPERRLREELRKLDGCITRIIMQRKLALEENPTQRFERDDLLSRFLLARMDEEEMRDAIVNLVMAGRDTTASALSWFLYCICMHPKQQEMLHADLIALESRHREAANLDGCHISSFTEFASLLTYDRTQELHQMQAALFETLRLYPSVPRDGKVAIHDDVLPDGTRVKAGQQVTYMPYAMGRMSFLWGPDALEFKPERWLNEDGTFHSQSPFKFSAFQAGPRMCLGRDAAFLQMKVAAALLLRFFRFSLVQEHPVRYRMMMVMTMKHGLKVQVTPRRMS